jgi:dipeptidyl aminopeptidase/acylaminoacyl peptidase
MTRISCRLPCVAFALGTCVASARSQTAAGTPTATARHLTVDDVLAIQKLGGVAISPDGEWIAVVVERAATTHETYGKSRLGDGDRSDIWLIDRRSGERRNLTNGVVDGSTYWQPEWSPDGQRIALLSTKGGEGENVHVYVWDKATTTLTRVSERGVNLDMFEREAFEPGSWTVPLHWIDNVTLMWAALPDDALANEGDLRTAYLAQREWAKALHGSVPTASRLESGAGAPPVARIASRLVTHNVATGDEAVMADGMLRFAGFKFAPDGAHAVILENLGPMPQPPDRPLHWSTLYGTRVGLLTVGARPSVQWFSNMRMNDSYSDLGGGEVMWSPDGHAVAIIGKSHIDDTVATELWVFDAKTSRVQRPMADSVLVLGTAWTPDSRLLVHVRPKVSDTAASGTVTSATKGVTQSAWLLVEAGRPPRNLSTMLAHMPNDLEPGFSPTTVIGIADSALWSIDVDQRTEVSLTTGVIHDPESILWSSRARPGERGAGEADILVLADRTPLGAGTYYRMTAGSGGATGVHPVTTTLSRPDPNARLAAYDPAHDLTLFRLTGATGTRLWSGRAGSTSADSAFTTLVALNGHLAGIRLGRDTVITYRSLDGETLRADVLLPVDYQRGRRYPVLTWVYPGTMIDSIVHPHIPNAYDQFSMQLLAAHGYVVLEPSIPLGPAGKPGDPFLELTKSVLPAVDKLIDVGIADSNRLAIGGHSYGGYATYALATYTNRFKAAIAANGLSDLISDYGTLNVLERYTAEAADIPSSQSWAEEGQGRMGVPPLENLWRYMRNNPLFYADRIQTPLLIVQGDQDFVSITQGEEMFSALYRQGKRARFVRYWGEGHAMTGPANIRDFWDQIFDWLDTYVTSAHGSSTPVGAG